MFQALQQAVGSAVVERVVLLANHVVSSEPAAQERLRGHAGKCLVIASTGWPALMPAWPALAFIVTPAGLLEWGGAGEPGHVDLRLTIDASDPAGLLAGGFGGFGGRRPPVDVTGDPAFAADVSWLMDHLRWDVEDDLAKLVGPGVAHQLARAGGLLARGLRETVRTFSSLGDRFRPDGSAPPR